MTTMTTIHTVPREPPSSSSASGVAVGADVGVGVGGIAVAVGGTAVAVAVGGTAVAVGGSAVAVGAVVAVGAGGTVGVGAAVGNGVDVGNGVGVAVGVAVGTGVGVSVAVGVAVGSGVGVGVAGIAVGVGRGVGVTAPSVKFKGVVITKFARNAAVGLSRVGRTSPVAGSTSENSRVTPAPLTAEACTSMRYWFGARPPFPVRLSPNRSPVDCKVNCTTVPAGAGAPSIVTRPVNTVMPPWADTSVGARPNAKRATKNTRRPCHRGNIYPQSRKQVLEDNSNTT